MFNGAINFDSVCQGNRNVWRVYADMKLSEVRAYIEACWDTLTRSRRDILTASKDPKFALAPGSPVLVYLSAKEDRENVERILRQALAPDELARIEIRRLPEEVQQLRQHGVLYLPHDYVVPGGRFNELYGWDSYFIQIGLLRDGRIQLARHLVDNFVYEIEHYGAILNANRSYYLTRSQPPFLGRMILAVFEQTQDRQWLTSTLPAVQQCYDYWLTPSHLAGRTGLSRYFDSGAGPAPEVVSSERDEAGMTHYDRVKAFYRTNTVEDYEVREFYDFKTDCLTPLFYQGDRSMRESGFDPSNRFGPFGVDIIRYAPVCLNALLYQLEQDAAQMNRVLGNEAEVGRWLELAQERCQRINQLLWDEQAGLYYDYNFMLGERRNYEFATTFYPLWAGLASQYQAKRVFGNLARFEAAGGLLTSTRVTGSQWDAPFGWAPLQWIAIHGLRRYGYFEAAERLAQKFIALVVQAFEQQGCLVEKYDVERCSARVSADIQFGYSSNEIGFGWTNGVLVGLLDDLDEGSSGS